MVRKALATHILALIILPTTTGAQSKPDSPLERAQRLEKKALKLSDQYLDPAVLESRYRFESRFNDAKVAYFMEDYGRASLIFLDILNSPGATDFEGYRETLFLLGESLYKEGNYLSARRYYTRLIDDGRGSHYRAAMVRLLKIASRTRNYEGLEKLYEKFDATADLGAPSQYMQGKVQFEQGHYQAARRYLLRASESDDYYFVAKYFAGVTYVAETKYQKAIEQFRTILTADDIEGPKEKKVLHLTYMALGRIAYENDNFEKSVDYYRRVPRQSPFFDRALYELMWVLVAGKNLKAAIRVVDIFFYLSNPDPTYVPQVKLLKADLLLRQGKYDAAKRAYLDVAESFEPVGEQLDHFMRQHRDLETYFHKTISANLENLEPDYLPEKVQKWVDRSPSMRMANQNLGELKRLLKQIESSRIALQRVGARLNSGTRLQSFPTIVAGRKESIDLLNKTNKGRSEILNVIYEKVEPSLSSNAKKAFRETQKKVEETEKSLQKLPNSSVDIEKRKKEIEKEFGSLYRQLENIKYLLRTQKAEIDAVRTYLNTDQAETLNATRKQKANQLIKELQTRIERLRTKGRQLERFIKHRRVQFGFGDARSKLTRRQREKMNRLLNRQWDLIQSAARKTSQTAVTRLVEAHKTLQSAQQKAHRFRRRTDEFVRQRVNALKNTLRQESQNLTQLEKKVRKALADASDVAAKMAKYDFIRIKNKFEQIIRRGQLGQVDVAWQKKEDVSEKIEAVIDERTTKIDQLEKSFRQLK